MAARVRITGFLLLVAVLLLSVETYMFFKMESNLDKMPLTAKFNGVVNYLGYGSLACAIMLGLVSLKLLLAGSTNKIGVTAIILIVFGVLLGAAINYGVNGPTSDQIDAIRKLINNVGDFKNPTPLGTIVNFLISSLYVPPIATAVVGLSLFTLHPELNPFKLF